MEKLSSLKSSQGRHSLRSNYLGCFKNAEQQLRSIAIDFLEAFVDEAPTERQIVDLESRLKTYLIK